ncbi:MAG: redoxin domain-containing protein, partial [Planctomycetota bacterium]
MVCVMPWNLLLWLGKRRLVRLSEQACDDWVVAAGQPGTDYAESLLDLAPQGQMAFAPAVLSSKSSLRGRVRRILQDKCGNPRTGMRWALAVTVVVACVAVGVAFAQARPAKVRPATKPMAQPISGSKLMDDRNVLDGIMPVIKLAVEGKVGEQRPRIPRLHSEPGPGILQGIVKDSADTSEHMTFWYLANVNESFEITGIPPGTYYLFTVETSNPRNIDDVGLPVNWPKPVKIRADGKPAHVEIEVSAYLSKRVRTWNLQGSLDGVGHLNEENMAMEELGPYGRVVDAKGRPVPYAMVYVREFKPSGSRRGGIKTPDARTNGEGYYGLRPLSYRYYVGANTYESLKHLAGFRSQSLQRNKAYEGKQRVNFQLGPWLPEKTVGGTIEGTVADANGNPIPSFTVTVSPDKPWVHVDQTEEPWTKRWWLRAAFSGGKFKLSEIPPSSCNVRIQGHKSSARSSMELSERKITVADGEAVRLEFKVEDWEKKREEKIYWYSRTPGAEAEREEPERLPELKVGEQAPAFKIQTIDGKKWALTDYRGKVVLLCFWRMNQSWTEIECSYFKSTYEAFGADERFVMMSLV